MELNDTLTAIAGLRVGHAEMLDAPTGCTVILMPQGVPAGVDVRGGAPGTYGTDTLNPLNLVDRVHGMFFTGGSGFGMSVGDGLRQYLRSEGVGFDSGHGRIPIVCGAVIFDLGLNHTGRYPDPVLALQACHNASSERVVEGCVGAGTGATVGKLFGIERAMKGGLGSSCIQAVAGLQVAALMVVNAFGDIRGTSQCELVAGCREDRDSLRLVDADREMHNLQWLRGFPEGQNTVVGVVATNAQMNKTQLTKVAQMAHDGLARTVAPAHTLYDGDTIFALSCGSLPAYEVTVIGALAAQATAHAILRAVTKARRYDHLPAAGDLP
ncbi:MAG TPA: peptidase [Syntrophobacteraceae bacterium]|nr:peptidase [Syntrophobacteraceae bacterium]HBZ56140.1 peptidase [Syntrophobacteraceae bacterium]